MIGYSDLRSAARTGDLVFFARMKPSLKIRHWAQVLGLLSNCLIAYRQLAKSSRLDGCWAFIHVGMIVRNTRDDELLLAEYTAGQRGAGLNRLSARVASYTAPVVYAPLRRALPVLDAGVAEWLRRHRVDAYNYAGLLFPTATGCSGLARPGRMFCSEAVVNALQWCGVLPGQRRVYSDSLEDLVQAPVSPWQFSPDELAGLRDLLDWELAEVIQRGERCS